MSILRIIATAVAIAPALALGNDYPTLDRVNYALDCMDRHGGPTIDNLISCSCEVDAVAIKVNYDEYTDANIYLDNRETRGDKGDAIRDSKTAKNAYKDLQAARKEAEKGCFTREKIVRRKVSGDGNDGGVAASPDAPAADKIENPAPAVQQ